jgi:transcriptional regulator of aromatic amino acid metabolism
MHQVFEIIHRVAPTDMTVLVQGETGTGKELVAKTKISQLKIDTAEQGVTAEMFEDKGKDRIIATYSKD